MSGFTAALQTLPPSSQRRRSANGEKIAGCDGESQERPHGRAMHDTEDQAAQQPHCEKA
jgi:hypothetical protein